MRALYVCTVNYVHLESMFSKIRHRKGFVSINICTCRRLYYLARRNFLHTKRRMQSKVFIHFYFLFALVGAAVAVDTIGCYKFYYGPGTVPLTDCDRRMCPSGWIWQGEGGAGSGLHVMRYIAVVKLAYQRFWRIYRWIWKRRCRWWCWRVDRVGYGGRLGRNNPLSISWLAKFYIANTFKRK